MQTTRQLVEVWASCTEHATHSQRGYTPSATHACIHSSTESNETQHGKKKSFCTGLSGAAYDCAPSDLAELWKKQQQYLVVVVAVVVQEVVVVVFWLKESRGRKAVVGGSTIIQLKCEGFAVKGVFNCVIKMPLENWKWTIQQRMQSTKRYSLKF